MNWAVTVYNEWHDYRIETCQYDVGIYFADLNNLPDIKKGNLCHSLCRFIPEVMKKKEGPYPGHTLHQMITSIQKHLNVNKIPWHLADNPNPEFEDVRAVLDNVMKEHTAANIGVTKRQAEVITYDIENRMWEEGVLGEDSPQKLHDTVLFLLGMNCTLQAVYEHYNLCREIISKKSQI